MGSNMWRMKYKMKRNPWLPLLPWLLLILIVFSSCGRWVGNAAAAPMLWFVVGLGIGLLAGILLASGRIKRR